MVQCLSLSTCKYKLESPSSLQSQHAQAGYFICVVSSKCWVELEWSLIHRWNLSKVCLSKCFQTASRYAMSKLDSEVGENVDSKVGANLSWGFCANHARTRKPPNRMPESRYTRHVVAAAPQNDDVMHAGRRAWGYHVTNHRPKHSEPMEGVVWWLLHPTLINNWHHKHCLTNSKLLTLPVAGTSRLPPSLWVPAPSYTVCY